MVHFGHKRALFWFELGVFFRRSYFFIIVDKTIKKSPSQTMFRATVPVAMVINRVAKIADFGHK